METCVAAMSMAVYLGVQLRLRGYFSPLFLFTSVCTPYLILTERERDTYMYMCKYIYIYRYIRKYK